MLVTLIICSNLVQVHLLSSLATMEAQESQSPEENGRFQPPPAPQQSPASRWRPSSNFIGKHRLQASISLLEQQIRIIETELQELETFDRPSAVCDGLIVGVESSPDPLLPLTRGPVDVSWERWFGGANGSRRPRRWI